MDHRLLDALIPIIAILATFGSPVAFLFVWKWFKLKDKELMIDAELQRSQSIALEARVQRLESIILALDPKAAESGLLSEGLPERLRT